MQYTPAQMIYRSFVTYVNLKYLVYKTFYGTSIAEATNLNVFIDLYSVYKPIFSEHGTTIIDYNDYLSVVPATVDMCAHYRSYFRQLGVKTKFFLVFSLNNHYMYKQFIPGYNATFDRKQAQPEYNQYVVNNLNILKTISPYLPEIYTVVSEKNYESSVIMSHLIDLVNAKEIVPNLVISNDIYPIQLTYLHPYTSYLQPIKTVYGDASNMLPISESVNYRKEFYETLRKAKKMPLTDFERYSPVNYPLLLAITGLRARDIPSIGNSADVKYIIEKYAGTDDTEVPLDLILSDEGVKPIIRQQIESRLKAFDLKYMKAFYKEDPESIGITFEDLNDPEALNTINSKVFANNPIDFQRLK